MKILRTCLVILLASGAISRADDAPGLPRTVLGAEGVILRRWLLLGPFEAKRGEAAVDVDFLAGLGRAEGECGRSEIAQWAAALPTATRGRQTARIVDGADVVDFGALSDLQLPPDWNLPQSAVYAACEIMAEADGEAWLLFGSDDGAKIWLNGRLQYAWREQRRMVTNEEAIALPLHRGANLLLVKVANIAYGWQMQARLEREASAAARAALERNATILKRALIPQGEPLKFRRGLPAPPETEVRLESYDGTITRQLRVNGDSPAKMADLPRGLYRVSLDLGTRRHAQIFYWGGLEQVHADLAAKCEGLMKEPRVAINLGTLVRWLEVLQRPVQFDAGDNEWTRQTLLGDQEKRVIFAVKAIYDAILRQTRGEEAFRHRAGLHLRGFRSPVDGQVLNYRLFVPSSYHADGAGLPLVIVMQTVFARPAPYLESVHVARLDEAEQWAQVAEKLGIGILWPGYRARPYGNPADLAHLDEVFAAVGADYRLDPSRLYLYGSCSGGLTASMEAIRHPQRYAAIAYISPVLHRVKNRFDDDGSFNAWPAYQAWLQQTDPVTPLAAIANIPIWIIHGGGDDDHGPLSHSVDLIEQARAMGHRPRFDNYRNQWPALTRLAIFEQQLAWQAQQRRTEPAPLDLANDNTGGPLSRVFAERFIVVEATGGNESERAANRRLSTEFQEAWRRTNYGPCRVIEDRELPAEEESRSHLVLLGNAGTNLIWNRLAARLPLTVEATRLKIGGRTHEGDALAFQAWFPHPVQPGKKVVLIGSAHPENAVFGTMELSLDGWFDYAIWKKTPDGSLLLAAERIPAAGTDEQFPVLRLAPDDPSDPDGRK
ncbi:MAG: alpha/beta hydrolase-fold protein [Verrucomicrobiota bacterium]